VSPSFVDDVVAATRYVIQEQPAHGVYHCVNSGHTTWLDLAREIEELSGRPTTTLTPISMSEVSLKAPRPRYAALDNGKLARTGYRMPTWQDALRRYLSRQ
jgi:dTDP-4-dehydrorhamnose reductase